MTTEHTHGNSAGSDEPGFDWQRAEADLAARRSANLDASTGSETGEEYESDTSFEKEFDSEPVPGPPVPVMPAPVADDTRQPIIPVHLRRENIVATVKHTLGRWLHIAGFHAVRVPVYAALATFWAIVGVGKVAYRQHRWWWLSEVNHLKEQAAQHSDVATGNAIYRGLLAEQRRARVRRGLVLVGELVFGPLAVWLAWTLLPPLVTVAALVGVIAWLAHLGRPIDRPIVSTAVVTPRYRKLNADVVLRAYYSAGLGKPDKEEDRVRFGSQMHHVNGGSRVVVDLPHGKTLTDAINARGKLASGLDVALSQVFISRDSSSHRRHVLWVADRDPLQIPAGSTPLLKCKPTDIWVPAPMGLDERGEKVGLDLIWNSTLVGALPRYGKTFTARQLGLHVALDPYTKISVFDPSAKPDWRNFAMVADSYAFGLVPTKLGDPVDIILASLRRIKADIADRYERLSNLDESVCPEGKLTRDIARNWAKYNMPVHVLVFEEMQELFNLGEASKEIAELLVYIVKVGPAAGYPVISSTQRPSGIGGGGELGKAFINFRDNHGVRFALRTGSWQMSDLILGSGSYSEGFDSSTLLPSYKGVGILRGASDANPTVRNYFADADDAKKILIAARELRKKANTLTGFAAGETTQREIRDVLVDVRNMFDTGEKGLHWTVLAPRLSERIPEHYADITADAISAQLRALGVDSVDVKVKGINLKGARAEHIAEVISRRKDTA